MLILLKCFTYEAKMTIQFVIITAVNKMSKMCSKFISGFDDIEIHCFFRIH